MKNIILLFFSLAILGLYSCCGADVMRANSWKLIAYGSIAAPTTFIDIPENNVTLFFSGDQFNGQYGCAGYSGTFSLGNTCSITKNSIASSITQSCNLSTVATDFFSILNDMSSYIVENDYLVIETNNGQFLRFEKLP